MEDLTPLQNGQIAVAAAVATTLSLQPTLYWKTACAVRCALCYASPARRGTHPRAAAAPAAASARPSRPAARPRGAPARRRSRPRMLGARASSGSPSCAPTLAQHGLPLSIDPRVVYRCVRRAERRKPQPRLCRAAAHFGAVARARVAPGLSARGHASARSRGRALPTQATHAPSLREPALAGRRRLPPQRTFAHLSVPPDSSAFPPPPPPPPPDSAIHPRPAHAPPSTASPSALRTRAHAAALPRPSPMRSSRWVHNL
jgi:hypothetical protein